MPRWFSAVVFALCVLFPGLLQAKRVHTAEPPLGNFLLQLSEASAPDALKTQAGIRESAPFGYECMPGDAYCHNDPINHVDVLGLLMADVTRPPLFEPTGEMNSQGMAMFRMLVPVVNGNERGHLALGTVSQKGIDYLCRNSERELKRIRMNANQYIASNENLLASIKVDQEIDLINARPMGAIRMVGGAAEAVLGGAGILAPEPATTAGGLVVFVHGADVASTGLRQMWTGQRERSNTAMAVTGGLNLLPGDIEPDIARQAGDNVDLAASLFGGGYGIGLARMQMVNPINQVSISTAGTPIRGASAGQFGDEFQSLLGQVRKADFGTQRNGSVFWSGWREGNQTTAMAWAKANGKQTIEMTKGGQWLEGLNLYGPSSRLTSLEADHIWRAASAQFARGASGKVNTFTRGTYTDPSKVFYGLELRLLKSNPSASPGIIYRGY